MNKLREYGIPRRTIQQSKALTKPKYPRKDFNGTPEEKSYIIGFRLGDLHISKTHPNSPTIRISTNTTRQEQLDLFSKIFSPYGHVATYPRDMYGARAIRCFANNSFDFLLKKVDCIDEWILREKKTFLSFLGGYTDAEGTFCICGGRSPVFSIKSNDKNILFAIHENIMKLGIHSNPPYLVRKAGSYNSGIRSNKDVYGYFMYSRKSLIILISTLLPFMKHEKRISNALNVLKYVRS